MQIQLPLFILCLLVHGAIFLTSAQPDRYIRLLAGLAVVFTTWPVWYGGYVLQTTGQADLRWLAMILVYARYYLPLLSFLVYWRNR